MSRVTLSVVIPMLAIMVINGTLGYFAQQTFGKSDALLAIVAGWSLASGLVVGYTVPEMLRRRWRRR